jgi:ribose-phosphate pyrophosphokinase
VCSLSGFTSSEQVSPRRKTLQKRLFAEEGTDSNNEEYEAWPVQSNTMVAKMVMTSGADHVITMDLHDPQFQGFFDIPVDNLPSLPMIVKCIQQEWPNIEDIVIVSPDAGGAKRATKLADALEADFALVHQDRKSTATSMLVGEVKGKIAILLDDIVDTSETLVRAADLLFDRGAKDIVALITHGIFAPGSVEMIERSRISKLFVSNTIPQESLRTSNAGKIKTFDVSGMFAEAIRRTHNGESVSFLFQPFAFL